MFSQVLQDVLRRLDKNFRNFLRGNGYPRFKGRNRYSSFTYPQFGFELLLSKESNSCFPKESKIKNGKLNLSKIGSIRIILHREIEGRIKTLTIKKDIDQWYAVFTVEIEKTIEPVEPQTSIGVDVGLSSLITLSSGEHIAPPKFLGRSEEKLAKEQIRLSRKKRGSANRLKQRVKVARLHRKIRNQRKDFAHKTSRWLVGKFDRIIFEDLQIQNMMQSHHLAKSISDAGWGQLIQFTAYKAAEAGKLVELVNPNSTSQNCSNCGNKVPKDLSIRVHSCPFCGLVLDRDINAGINVLKRSTAGTAGRACMSSPAGDAVIQEAPCLSVG